MRLRARRLLGQNGSLLGIGGISYTNCYPSLTQLTDGGYGLDAAQVISGLLLPDTTADGTLIYSASFYSNGDFIMSFGALGNEQLTNVLQIIKEFNEGHIELFWNATNNRYEGTNLTLATELILLLGTEVCFADIAIPDLLIDIDFFELETV